MGSATNSLHLRMSAWIVQLHDLIHPGSYDGPIAHDHRSERTTATLLIRMCKLHSLAHKRDFVGRHDDKKLLKTNVLEKSNDSPKHARILSVNQIDCIGRKAESNG